MTGNPAPAPTEAPPTGTALRLHLHPGTSGLAPNMALLATGAAFEVRAVDLMRGEHRRPDFLALNPFGTVPVLEDGAAVVTETGAILLHVAERFPGTGLLPGAGAARAQVLRWLFHAAAIHADFMTWRRSAFKLPDPRGQEAAQAWMSSRLADAFHAVDRAMAGPYLAGSDPSMADLYLFMIAGWWRKRFDFARDAPRLTAALNAVAELPFVQQAYAGQGSDLPCFDGAPSRARRSGQAGAAATREATGA